MRGLRLQDSFGAVLFRESCSVDIFASHEIPFKLGQLIAARVE